jgi:hypothetical protein
VGLTVVAFGTSASELAVSIGAGLSGQADIALGNVVGSNVFNVLLILGASALIAPLAVSNQLVRLDVPLMVGLSGLVGGSRLTVASDGATGSFWSWASSPTPSAVAFIFAGEIALALGEAGALLVHARKTSAAVARTSVRRRDMKPERRGAWTCGLRGSRTFLSSSILGSV